MASMGSIPDGDCATRTADGRITLLGVDGMALDGKYTYPNVARVGDICKHLRGGFIHIIAKHTQAINRQWSYLCSMFSWIANDRADTSRRIDVLQQQ